MNRRRLLAGASAGMLAMLAPRPAGAVLNIDITQGNPRPMPIALPDFLAGSPTETDIARNVTAIIANNLQRSGLFAPINPQAFTEKITNSDAVPRFADWRVINAQALVTGRITKQGDGRLKAEFRLWDGFAGQPEGHPTRRRKSKRRVVAQNAAENANHRRVVIDQQYAELFRRFHGATGRWRGAASCHRGTMRIRWRRPGSSRRTAF